jgi:hypothetical protein
MSAKVTSIKPTNFPGISEINFKSSSPKASLRVEIPTEVITFSQSQSLKLTFTKKSPTKKQGLVLRAMGKVIRRQKGADQLLRVSFYGLQGWLTVSKNVKLPFAAMDDIFLSAYNK